MQVILNGYDEIMVVRNRSARGQLSLLYAGSLYRSRNPFPLLEAISWLLSNQEFDREKITVKFVGSCQCWSGIDVREYVEDKGMSDRVQIHPSVGSAEIAQLIAESNVLINFAQDQEIMIPAKTFEYIGYGKESLVLTEEDSDTAALVREVGVGKVVAPDDRKGMIRALQEFYDFYVNQRRIYEVAQERLLPHSRASQSRRYLDLVDRVLQ